MIGLIASLFIKGAVKVGIGEGAAGAMAASRIFGPLAMLLIGAAAVLVGWGALKLHDHRITTAAANEATVKCVSEHQVKAMEAKVAAQDAAIKARDRRDLERQGELVSLSETKSGLERENAELRAKVANAGGDGVAVFEHDDCWLRKSCGDGARAPAAQPRAGGR